MADYGKRVDGAAKGKGFFGELKRPDGRVSTELSVGVDMGEGEEQIPLLVPTLTRKQIDALLAGARAPREVIDAAVKWAVARKRAGLSAFATSEEEGLYKIPNE